MLEDNEELELGVRCMAAGIHDDTGKMIARALSISPHAMVTGQEHGFGRLQSRLQGALRRHLVCVPKSKSKLDFYLPYLS